MTLTPFRGRCHTCGHDHDAEDTRLRDVLDIVAQAPRIVTLPPMPEHDVHIYGIEEGSSFAATHHAFTMAALRDYATEALRAAGVEVAP